MFESEELDKGDELGPGTDLILSLLSVVITILAVVSFSQPAPVDIHQLCQGVDCGPEGADKVNTLSAELTLDTSARTIEELRGKLAESQSSLLAMERRLNEEKLIQPGDILELHGEVLSIFARNKAKLEPKDVPLLKNELYPLYLAVTDKRANIIRIHGHASPEPRRVGASQQLDHNMDLSVERSLAISHALHRLGIPYRCMVVEGYGRNQSPFLNSYLKMNAMSIEDWDRMYLRGYDTSLSAEDRDKVRAKLEKLYQRDRRVNLVATYEPDALCTVDELADSLFEAVTQ